MNLPFYYSTSIKTKLSPDDLKTILYNYTITDEGKTEKDQTVLKLINRKIDGEIADYIYIAKFKGYNFKIIHVLGGSIAGKPRNSFNPKCYGKICAFENTSEIKIKFLPSVFAIILALVILLVPIFALIEIALSEIKDGRIWGAFITPIILSPFYLAFWLFHKFGFKKEVMRTLDFLMNTVLKNKH